MATDLPVGTGGGSLRVRALPGAADPLLLAAADEGRGFTADIIMGMAVKVPAAGGEGKWKRTADELIKRGVPLYTCITHYLRGRGIAALATSSTRRSVRMTWFLLSFIELLIRPIFSSLAVSANVNKSLVTIPARCHFSTCTVEKNFAEKETMYKT